MIPTIERIHDAAIKRGYDGSALVMSVDSDTGERIALVVSGVEPTYATIPLNSVWYNPESSEILVRQSRTRTDPYNNTWVEATEENFWEEQIWDVEEPSDWEFDLLKNNIGNTHNLTISEINGVDRSGDKLEGALYSRDLEDGEDFADDELAPAGWIDSKLIAPVKGIAFSVYSQLTSIRNALTKVRNRVTVNESDIEQLQNSVPIVFDQSTPSIEWKFPATLTSPALFTVIGGDGNYIIPVSQNIVTSEPDGEGVVTSEYSIKFSAPRSGKVIIIHS